MSRHYAESHLRGIYHGDLYYGRDAFEGLRICDHLANGDLRAIDTEIADRLAKRADVEQRVAAGRSDKTSSGASTAVAARSSVAADVELPKPPFWGDRVIEQLDLDDVYPFINTVALFRGQWGFKKGSMSQQEYADHLRDVVHPIFERLKAECADAAVLRPQVVYGYYPCQSEGDDLIVYDAADHDRELERFTFPRQRQRDRLCISDFFRSVESGEKDVIGLQCVTVGPMASEKARELFEQNEYTEYLYLHGLGVETAEALAELWHKRMRAELSIGSADSPEIRKLFSQNYRGSRYSFGYPACPEMSDQEKLFKLIGPDRIGCSLTENWQIDPEQSTSAIVVHHPQAKYFSV